MDRPGVPQVPEGSGEQGQMEKTGRKIICGAPTTLAVKGLMMMMMITPYLSVLCAPLSTWQVSVKERGTLRKDSPPDLYSAVLV